MANPLRVCDFDINESWIDIEYAGKVTVRYGQRSEAPSDSITQIEWKQGEDFRQVAPVLFQDGGAFVLSRDPAEVPKGIVVSFLIQTGRGHLCPDSVTFATAKKYEYFRLS